MNLQDVDVRIVALALGCLLVAHWLLRSMSWNARTRGRPLPPGPRGLPILGNVLDMPQSKAWYGFRDLSSLYGEYCSGNYSSLN